MVVILTQQILLSNIIIQIAQSNKVKKEYIQITGCRLILH